jgi:GTPase Era involved in 16S rRNA processing
MPEHMEEKLRDWLSTCPYAEYIEVNYAEEYGGSYIVNVSIAIEKESEKDV